MKRNDKKSSNLIRSLVTKNDIDTTQQLATQSPDDSAISLAFSATFVVIGFQVGMLAAIQRA